MRTTIILLLLLGLAASGFAESTMDVSRAGNTFMIPLRVKGNVTQVDIASLAAALEIETSTDSNGAWFTVKTPQVMRLRVGNPWVGYGATVLQLPLPVERSGNNYWTPLQWTITRLTEDGVEEAIYDSPAKTLTVRPGKAIWKGIAFEKQGNDSLHLTLLLPAGPRITTFRNDTSVTFSVYGAKILEGKFALNIDTSLVKKVNKDLKASPARVTVITKRSLAGYDSLDSREFRIRVQPDDATLLAAEQEKLKSQLAEMKRKWAIDCVVIDAGHGGKDPGARGRGLQEKDLTLDIALRLASELRKVPGLKVVLTRDKDVFVTLQDRGKIANKAGGKLFVSIHINAARSSKAYGIETYFLSPARTERAVKVSEFENSVVQLEDDNESYKQLTDEKHILVSMAQSQFLLESQVLAEAVHKEAIKRTGLNDRGVDQAGFYVLIGASMPAILFECAFLTNSSDARKLRSSEGRQKFADALYAGIMKFREQAEQGIGVKNGKPERRSQ
ncbi:MAG: N-acetylmuramoyl-L-alanine amidase [bacterium]|nr:N-acetylmuramoyl-L-alanine amidase [bacterium]